jgi:hypothetical protein
MKARTTLLTTAALAGAGFAFRKIRFNLNRKAAQRRRRQILSQGLRTGRLAAAIAGVTFGSFAAIRAARS